MVFLVLTRPALDELASHFGRLPSPLWVNKGLLSKQELADLRAKGIDVSDFTNNVPPNDLKAIDGVLAVIAEHHYGHAIWVECHSTGFQGR